MVPTEFFDGGPYLALIDGKFLPVESIKFDQRLRTNQSRSSSSSIKSNGVSATQSYYSATIETTRCPGKLLSHSSCGYIFSKEKQIVFDDMVTITTEMGSNTHGWRDLFEIELTAVSFSVEAR